jgi:hypothetical protein
MTALSTSLAFTLWPRGSQILMAMAVRECLMRQYWRNNDRLNSKNTIGFKNGAER